MKCESILRIKAHTPEAEIQLNKLLELIITKEVTLDLETAYPVPATIKYVPFPTLKMFSNIIHVLYDQGTVISVLKQNECSSDTLQISSMLEHYIQGFKIILDGDYKMGEVALENLKNYGFTNEYDWKSANWGTGIIKDVTIVTRTSNFFCFACRSLDKSIVGWVEKVSKDYPLLDIHLEWEVPGQRAHSFTFFDGNSIHNFTGSIWSI